MNSTSAVEVSIHAVSPELIFDESTENGAVGAAGAAAAEASAGALAAGAADASAAGALAVVAVVSGADAAAGADASSATALPMPAASSEPTISRDIKSLRISGFLLSLFFYRASAPVSPVRIRITCSIGVTKILPSPILPVRAARSSA